jgi:hypothetical protein
MKWNVDINNLSLGGFAPAYYKETYPSYGNKNQAGAMVNIDCTNPGFISQGPGLANLTNGTQAAAVTTLIKGALDFAAASDASYGVGGAKLYKFTSTAVTNAGDWPHTINKAAVTDEDGEDVALFQGAVYYSYNHSGTLGDIGKYDLASTFDDDWGSTVPSGMSTLVGGVPHPMKVGGNDTMAIGNGRYVALFDGTTFQPQALDFPVGSVVQDIEWNSDRWWVTVNRPNLTGANKNTASIFVWDGTTNSWEAEITLMGTAGGSHVKNGVLLQFYQDISSTGGYKLAYVNGGSIVDICNYTGGLPAFYQITDYKDFIIWNAGGLIHAYGSGDKDLPVRLFQLADGGYATVGTVVCPFGTPIIASTESTSYKLATFSGYDVTSSWKSLMFDVTASGRVSKIDMVRINFETLAANARVNWRLLNNKGEIIYSDIISHTKLGAVTTAYYPLNGKVAENFRIEFDYANGNATNTVKIKNCKIHGNSD